MSYDPYDEAEELGITVAIGNFRELDQVRADGLWLPNRDAILLRPSLTYVQERCLLAHELGHAVHGHRATTPKNEMLADRYAAERLVDRAQLLALMVAFPEVYARWAIELQVTTKVMRMYLGAHRLDLARERTDPYHVEPMVLRAVG